MSPNLAGGLHLYPGRPVPTGIVGGRPVGGVALGSGLAAVSLPDALAAVFNLCGHAHRLCSQQALQALALPMACADDEVASGLRRETALEHTRRIGLDWPRLLAPEAGLHGAAIDALRRCPLNAPGTVSWAALSGWLSNECLRMPAAQWLARWQRAGVSWLKGWSAGREGWLASLLHEAQPADVDLPWQGAQALHAGNVDAQRLDAAMAAARDGDCTAWAGRPVHTGHWCRASAQAPAPTSAWGLLGSRLAELAQLATLEPTQPLPLAWGAQRTGERSAIAWVEMARGLLVHRVVLDATGTRVAQCQVLAPTDWNWHPEGVAAQALAALRGSLQGVQARLLVAAFDPCLAVEIAREDGHA
ncbi:MAG: hypothetical protein KF871_04075 [Hydrogenophaga sp.]|uniref:hypothetical protein n=1 Tax=Hydrogenophaga sp. TaxID=1904254 RepID=UPI001DDF838B|nr:hypothetical protein [Hydrogenophaga sp.]MBX3609051.1 hypothetical protein [Hydrogenophaga sp.]